jgi:uncharacterized coiled-coil protein SlyX
MSKIPPGARELNFYTYFTSINLKEHAEIPGCPKSKWTTITMAKKTVTLYVDEELISVMKERNYNVSFLFNETMKLYVDENYGEIEIAARLSALDEIIRDKQINIDKMRLEYEAEVHKLNDIKNRRQTMHDEFMEAQRTLRLSKVIRELNSVIVSCEFDVDVVRSASESMLKRIEDLSPYFNLEKHVARLKNTLS